VSEWLRADPATGAVVPAPLPLAWQLQLGPSTLEDVHGDGSRFLVATTDGRMRANADLHPAGDPTHGVVLAPRGARIAYVRFERDPSYGRPYADLLVAPRPGARAHAVLRQVLGAPAFSPDGQRLVAVQATDPDATTGVPRTFGAPARLVVVRADGRGRPRALAGTEDAQSAGTPPAWTADGRIVYVARRGVVALAADGRGRRTVLAPDRVPERLTVSADATHAAFTLTDGPSLHLAIARLDGHGPLIELPHGWTAAFSPDGHRLAVSHDDRVDVLSADGLRLLRALPATDGRSINPITWTPDGRRLLYHAIPPSPPD
jgi:Tol biopolymer transport system component